MRLANKDNAQVEANAGSASCCKNAADDRTVQSSAREQLQQNHTSAATHHTCRPLIKPLYSATLLVAVPRLEQTQPTCITAQAVEVKDACLLLHPYGESISKAKSVRSQSSPSREPDERKVSLTSASVASSINTAPAPALPGLPREAPSNSCHSGSFTAT